jgi:hypothetical protein
MYNCFSFWSAFMGQLKLIHGYYLTPYYMQLHDILQVQATFLTMLNFLM